jgi:hypothetical protein
MATDNVSGKFAHLVIFSLLLNCVFLSQGSVILVKLQHEQMAFFLLPGWAWLLVI